MANTEFYQKANSPSNPITWADIFSEFLVKHSKQDMEYAFMAGTSLNRASESDMLSKWRKPWLFWRVFLALAVLGALAVLSVYGGQMVGIGTNVGSVTLVYVFLPMIVPITLRVFFCELNIPRNISIYELLGFFLVGTVICFFSNSIMFQVVSFADEVTDTAWGAPLREEPAKLMASVAIMYWFSQRDGKKLYGLTGLVIGAAVGTGFSVFESISYGFEHGIVTAVARFLFAIVGHTMYCAPYAAAIAVHSPDSKLSTDSFFNVDFVATFICSVLMHMFWNSRQFAMPTLFKVVVEIIILWSSTLYVTRKCFSQVVAAAGAGAGRSPNYAGAGTPRLSGVSGCFAGRSFALSSQGLRIGREPTNDVVFPQQNARGVSRNHCLIRFDPQSRTFILIDQNSSNGTFLENGVRLSPGMPVTLSPGERFYIADRSTSFRVDL